MKRLSLLKVGVFVLFSLVIVSISFAGGHRSKPWLPHIPEVWTKIMPDPEFEYNGLKPGCSGCPSCISDEFYFFAKGGKGKRANNLIIFFQGGGACWHSNNCIYPSSYTYCPQILEEVEDLEAFEGIFDMDNPKNPFKKWSFVFIPYCTGDIHWGAYDKEYDDVYGGGKVTIKHRGFVNFQAVLEWIAGNFNCPRKIFVTGSSAGSYGALNAFPYIKETFPQSKAYLLGDAGNGVIEEGFQNDYVNNWNPQYPKWIFDPGEWSLVESNIAEMYSMIGASYPHSKIAQYTTAWDETQAFFFNVMLNIESPSVWENLFPVWCYWHEQMLEHAYFTEDAPNYRYYIAAGTDHTILRSEKFYEEESAGIPFKKWVKAMVKNPLWSQGHWKNLECEDCEDPFPCPQ